jgi:hypothetical protein
MHLTCTNMPQEKVDIALRVRQLTVFHLNITDWYCRMRKLTAVGTFSHCVVTLRSAKTNGRL